MKPGYSWEHRRAMAADDYEKTYLGAEGGVHREKRIERTTFRILSVFSGLLGLVGVLAIGAGMSHGAEEHAVGGMIGTSPASLLHTCWRSGIGV